MTLKSLFKKREALYYKDLLKYFRYIFNDHFSLVIFFMIGAGGYAYSNYLDTLDYGSKQPLIFLLFVYFFFTSRSSITLVVEEADQIFLLPKEEDFYPVLKQSVLKSYLQSLLPIALMTFISSPILVQTQAITSTESWFIFLGLASLQWINLLVKIYPYFYQRDKSYQKYKSVGYLITWLTIIGMIFIDPSKIALIALIFGLVSMGLFLTGKIYFNHSLKWSTMIEMEEARLQKLYRFIQMFIDVPYMETSIHRLSVLDRLFDKLSARYPKAPYYYLLRMVARDPEYSLLVLRLTLIGSLVLLGIDSYLLAVGFVVLFIYLLGFQLISLVKELENVPQFQLYPITNRQKRDSALRLINQLLIFMTVFFTISGLISLGGLGLTVFPIGIIVAYVFSYFYVPTRLKG